MSAAESSSDNPLLVTSLNVNDVLFGRGSGPNDHEGNIRFRSLVSDRKAEYMATNHRQTKATIARDIVNAVLAKNGRFLKKVEGEEAKRFGLPKGADAWCVVDDETIMEKAKQALRQQRDKGKSKSPPRARPPITTQLPPITVESFVNVSLSQQQQQQHSQQGRQQATPQRQQQQAIQSNMYMRHQAQSILGGQQQQQRHQIPSMMVSSPYEPIPIGGTMQLASEQQQQQPLVDWKQYADSGVLQQTPDFNPSHQMAMQQQRNDITTTQPLRGGEVTDLTQQDSSDKITNNRRESFQVGELMDSFTHLRTKQGDEDDDGQRDNHASSDTMGTIATIGSMRYNESTDTMGTIEPLPMSGRDTGVSLTGSTMSLLKGALSDSSKTDAFKSDASISDAYNFRGVDTTPTRLSAGAPTAADSAPSCAASASVRSRKTAESRKSITMDDFVKQAQRPSLRSNDMSMSLSQVMGGSERKVLGGVIDEENESDEASKKDGQGKKKLADDPRPVVLMEDDPDTMSTLGKSSMSILNIAMGEDSGILTVANDSIFSDLGD